MAREVQIETQGLREFRRDLKRMEPAIDKELRADIKAAAARVLAQAKADAPKQTGALSDSLRVSLTARGASIYSRLPYAPVVHWGGTIEPRGAPITFRATEFISRAIEAGADRLLDDIGDGVERAANRAGWHR
jgi:hypothetical protein